MNIDEYKLSNPTDDGLGSGMVSNCCGAETGEGDISTCCGVSMWGETDICGECREHADRDEMCCFECGDICDEIEDYEYKQQQKESAEESARDGERDEN